MTSLKDLPESIRKRVDFIIYDGEIRGSPSKIVDLTLRLKQKVVYLRRAKV